MIETSTTLDGLLNHRVVIEQPAEGYRVAVDTVFLAAAVPALGGDKVLDMGCGVGGAMLCLACRVPQLAGLGVEIQGELVELCYHNIGRNDFASGLLVRRDDATSLPADLRGGFDHVLMNPPYHEEARHDVSVNPSKEAANTEKTGALSLWIASAALSLRPSGTLTLIHRWDRLSEVLSFLQPSFGEVEVLPIAPKKGSEPKRVIVRGRKDALFSVKQSDPFILHEDSGKYTERADAVLRKAEALWA